MQYKTLTEQIKKSKQILKKNKELMDILYYISTLNLSNYYIASGSVFQTIWNYYDNKPLNNNIKDIDVVYYNKEDLSLETDLKYYNLITKYCKKKGYNYEIDVSNEARMHLWKKKKYNVEIEPYINCEDAIGKWTATICSIGITLNNNKLEIYAPYGLSDIYSKTIRPIKHKSNTKTIYYKKAKSWSNRFNNLTIIDW